MRNVSGVLRFGVYLPVVFCVAVAFVFAQDDAARAIKDGGIFVQGWAGKIDAGEEKAGLKLDNAKLAGQNGELHVTTGPAVTYWNPANTASGSYTVKATFVEPEYMNINDHAHPYGLVIAGNDMGTAKQSYLYCAAYGDGRFIVRGFGPEPFQMNGRRGEPHDAVNKAAGKGQPVTQEIALSVKDHRVECAINGTVVASYAKADVVQAGRLVSTDGVYGLRFAHNTSGVVRGLSVTKD
jgi:hypothetical protein